MKKKPSTKNDFLQAYLYACGRSEVPKTYNSWCGISLVAALLQNRVWVEKDRGSKLYPNLYLFLIGPPGCGKGIAIGRGLRIINHIPHIRTIRGRMTGAGLADEFAGLDGQKKKRGTSDQPIVLEDITLHYTTEELAESIGSGPHGQDFIRRMTAWYTGGDAVITERTRNNGKIVFKNPCINWIAGSTVEWLMECVPRSAIEGGFLGRTLCVEGDYSTAPKDRIYRPWVPEDVDAVEEWLLKRAKQIAKLSGQFTLTKKADEAMEEWYKNRPEPPSDEPALRASWKRADVMVLKLGQILAASGGKDDGKIYSDHILEAIELAGEAQLLIPTLIRRADFAERRSDYDIVARYIRVLNGEPIMKSDLLRKCSNRAIKKKELNSILGTLIDEGHVIRLPKERGTAYAWDRGEDLETPKKKGKVK